MESKFEIFCFVKIQFCVVNGLTSITRRHLIPTTATITEATTTATITEATTTATEDTTVTTPTKSPFIHPAPSISKCSSSIKEKQYIHLSWKGFCDALRDGAKMTYLSGNTTLLTH